MNSVVRPFATSCVSGDACSASATGGAPSRARTLILLAVLAMLVYANALRTGFTFDDEPDIQKNPAVTGGVDWVEIFATPLPPGDLYRPFTVLTFAINERLAPGNAAAYHALNVVLHAGVTVLVCLLALRLFGGERVAVLATALFAVHPIHTEAVTSLVGRAELLAALFGLLALLSVPPLEMDRRRARVGRQAASLVCFALAMLSKESALVVVPLIPLFRIASRGESWRAGVWKELRSLDWAPYALCACSVLVLRALVVGGLGISTVTALDNPLAFVPASVRVRSALGVLWDYFALLNFPLVLGADYSFAQVPLIASWVNPRCVAGLGLLGAAAVILVRDRHAGTTFAVALAVGALSLTSNVLFPIGTVKGERLLYLPSVGWVLLAGYGLDRVLHHARYRRVAAGIFLAVIAGFAARTWTRNWDWTDNPTLYRSLVRSAPNSAKSRYNLGVTLLREDADEAAAAQFHRALEIFPWGDGAGSPWGLGLLAEKRGRTDEAVMWFQKALEIDPGFDKAHRSVCGLLVGARRFKAAARACRSGLRYYPADVPLLTGLGESWVGTGDVERGVAVLRRALVLDPDDHALRARVTQLEAAGGEEVTGR
jgi:protein O-mannosyl-transferase